MFIEIKIEKSKSEWDLHLRHIIIFNDDNFIRLGTIGPEKHFKSYRLQKINFDMDEKYKN